MIAKNYIFGRKYGTNFLDGLVAYYPLNSNANDFSGKGHNGILVNSPTFTTGKVGNAINFGNDATARYFQVADNDDFSFTNGTTDVPFSISIWVNFSAFGATGNWLINKRGATSGTDEWQIMYYQNRLFFWKFQFDNRNIYQGVGTGLNPFNINTWYHICYTDSGNASVGSGKLYINGVANVAINQNVGGTYTKMNNGTNLVRVGYPSWSPPPINSKHKGLIDELLIYKNRELTATEVLELYNKGNAGIPII